MKQIEVIQHLIPFHQQIEQIKTSIDVIIKQENEYEQNFKKYSIKEFELKQKEGETSQEAIDRIETILDRIYDLNKRNDLNMQTINELKEKMKTLETNLNNHLNILNNDKRNYEMTIQQTNSFINEMNEKNDGRRNCVS